MVYISFNIKIYISTYLPTYMSCIYIFVVFLVNGLNFAVIARKQKDKNTTEKTFKTKI